MDEYISTIADAHHSKIAFEYIKEKRFIIKKLLLSQYNSNPREVEKLYITYRNEIRRIYLKIPELNSIEYRKPYLYIKEEFIDGPSLKEIIKEGFREKWLRCTELIFLPLVAQIKSTKVNYSKYVSHFPLSIFIDIKPANVIYHKERQAIPIDFFPPLLIKAKGNYFIHTNSAYETEKVMYAYGDLEVLLAKHFFETRDINKDFSRSLEGLFVDFCKTLDSSGVLAQRIQNNVIESNETCPNCPYCSGKITS